MRASAILLNDIKYHNFNNFFKCNWSHSSSCRFASTFTAPTIVLLLLWKTLIWYQYDSSKKFDRNIFKYGSLQRHFSRSCAISVLYNYETVSVVKLRLRRHSDWQSSSRFNSRTVLSSPYCITWNKWAIIGPKLWPVIETSVLSANNDITVSQTERTHTHHICLHIAHTQPVITWASSSHSTLLACQVLIVYLDKKWNTCPLAHP